MLDLTGDFLLTYLIRELKDVVKRHPRFRKAGGETLVQSSSGISFGDVRVSVSSVSNQGTRLSPDYFMFTQWGRSVLGKVPNKDGLFVEWVEEDHGVDFPPAIYYLYVDSVDESTREVKLLVRTFKWSTGKLSSPAEGSIIYFNKGIDPSGLVCSDSTLMYDTGTSSILLRNLPQDMTKPITWSKGGIPLIPLVDYWISKGKVEIVLDETCGGGEIVHLPPVDDYIILDSSGYVLRSGIDFFQVGDARIELGPYTPPGNSLEIRYMDKGHPDFPVNPENKLQFKGTPVLDTVWIKTSAGVYDISGTREVNGVYYLKDLLRPGYQLKWDVKVDSGDTPILVSKKATNRNIVEGLTVAIGDKVEVTDEVAIIVYPSRTQTYEVYGSTDNISFTIEVTANDRDTVSDLSAMIREHLLVKSRDRHESAGLTIYQMSSNSSTEVRDGSGIHTTTTREFSVEAAADWRYFSPLINRVGDIDISGVELGYDYPGNMQPRPFGTALGLKAWEGQTLSPGL